MQSDHSSAYEVKIAQALEVIEMDEQSNSVRMASSHSYPQT